MTAEMINFTNFKEVMNYAQMVSRSKFCPKDFVGRPEDVLIAFQMGHELGLKPMQALQNIAVINGRPSVWGDAMLALCEASGELDYYVEKFDEDNKCGVASIKRKGKPEHVEKFSVEQAKRARLWGKAGPWTDYPERMCCLRARGFALRKEFPHLLKGFISAEEAKDIPIPEKRQETVVTEAPLELNCVEHINTSTLEDLKILCMGYDDYNERMNSYLAKNNLSSIGELSEPAAQKILAALLKEERASELLSSKEGEPK